MSSEKSNIHSTQYFTKVIRGINFGVGCQKKNAELYFLNLTISKHPNSELFTNLMISV